MRIKQSSLIEFFEYPETPEDLDAFTALLKSNFKSDKSGFVNWIEKSFFDSLSNFKEEVDSSRKEIIHINPNVYKHLPTGDLSFKEFMGLLKLKGGVGFLFEEIVYDWLTNIQPELKDGFVEVLKNVKLAGGEKSGTTSAEHDFLMATKKGTLVSLDAKIGELPQKDLDARLLNLSRGSGAYAKFCVIIPLDQELYNQDLVQDHLLETIYKLHPNIPILGLGFHNDPPLLNPLTKQNIHLKSPSEFFKCLC